MNVCWKANLFCIPSGKRVIYSCFFLFNFFSLIENRFMLSPIRYFLFFINNKTCFFFYFVIFSCFALINYFYFIMKIGFLARTFALLFYTIFSFDFYAFSLWFVIQFLHFYFIYNNFYPYQETHKKRQNPLHFATDSAFYWNTMKFLLKIFF